MSDEYTDPSANTAQFQAFASRAEPAPPAKRTPVGLIVGIAALALVIVVVVAYLALT